MLAAHIFLVVLVAHVIGWIGKTKINALAYSLYSLATGSPIQQKQQALRRTILATKAEFKATSSQDEFAKWARLRRKMDKEVAELEKLNNELTTSRTKFSATFSSLLWIVTTGIQFFLVSWYRSAPVFYLPTGWFPSIVVWCLGLPFAPFGAISTAVWAMACRRTLSVISTSLGSLASGQTHQPTPLSTTSPLS